MADKPPTAKYHYVSIAIGFILLCCVGYQIIRPTQKTTIADGGSQTNYYAIPSTPLLSGGCSHLHASLEWLKDPSKEQGKKK